MCYFCIIWRHARSYYNITFVLKNISTMRTAVVTVSCGRGRKNPITEILLLLDLMVVGYYTCCLLTGIIIVIDVIIIIIK